MNLTPQEVELEKISHNTTYNLHPFLSQLPAKLKTSFIKYGILSPPILIQNENTDDFTVLCGHKRITHHIETGIDKCLCFIVYNAEVSSEEILDLILEDQVKNRNLSIMEQACFIRLCHNLIPDKRKRKKYLHSIPSGVLLFGEKFLLNLLVFNESIQLLFHEGILSEKISNDLSCFSLEDQKKICELIQYLQLNANNQRKLLSFLRDLQGRFSLSACKILESADTQTVLLDNELNIPQKSRRILEFLQEKVSPLLIKSTRDFLEEIKKMNLPPTSQLVPSASFEKDEVHLTIRFENIEQCKEFWKKAAPALNNK